MSSGDELIDPRIQTELEKLNAATELINKLEIKLDEERTNFRILLNDSTYRITLLAKKIGASIEKAQPYYVARSRAKQLQVETQRAALRFERANSSLIAAKEMVQLAEEDLNKGHIFDSARQEMLNHATKWVNDAETERSISEREHARTSAAYSKAERKVFQLRQELNRAIIKTKPYFELKAQLNQALENQRKNINQIEEKVIKIKLNYSETLQNLEKISEEIHHKRKVHDSPQLEERRIEGVGAESPINSENSYITKYEIQPKFTENSNFDQQSEKFSCNWKLQRNTSKENINIINDEMKKSKSLSICDMETDHQTIKLEENFLQKFEAFDLSSNECKIYDQNLLNKHKLYHKPFERNEENSDTDSLKSSDTLDDDQVESLLLDTYFLHKIMK